MVSTAILHSNSPTNSQISRVPLDKDLISRVGFRLRVKRMKCKWVSKKIKFDLLWLEKTMSLNGLYLLIFHMKNLKLLEKSLKGKQLETTLLLPSSLFRLRDLHMYVSLPTNENIWPE